MVHNVYYFLGGAQYILILVLTSECVKKFVDNNCYLPKNCYNPLFEKFDPLLKEKTLLHKYKRESVRNIDLYVVHTFRVVIYFPLWICLFPWRGL